MIVPITSIKIFEQEQKKKKKKEFKVIPVHCNLQLYIYLTRKKLSIFYKSTVATFDDHAYIPHQKKTQYILQIHSCNI